MSKHMLTLRTALASNTSIGFGLFLLSLALRLICLHQIQGTPLYGFAAQDSLQYEEYAVNILQGRLAFPEAIYLNAVYPFLLAAIYLVFGHTVENVLLVQVVFSAATTVLLYLLCLKVLNNKVVSLLAAGVFAGYDLSIFYSVVLLDTTLSAFLAVALVLALVCARDGRRPGLWLLSGVMFGLSMVLRANVALFLPFLVLWLSTQNDVTRRQKQQALVYLGVGLVLAVSPFSARRFASDGGLSPFPASGGLNFYIGNNPEATGGFVSLEHLNISPSPVVLIRQSASEAERRTGRRLSASQASDYWFSEGLQFIGEHPSRFVRLFLKKMLMFWNKNESESNINFYYSRTFLPILQLPLFSFVIVSPLALTGLVLVLRRRTAGLALVAWFVIAAMLSLALLFMASRYRFPALPLIIVLAAVALDRLWCSLRNKRTGEVAAMVAMTAVFFIGANTDLPRVMASDNYSAAQFNLGNLFLHRGLLDEAAGEYRKIPRTDPRYPRGRYNLALVYERKGMTDEAMAEYERVLAAKPDFSKAHNNLGLLYFKRGRREKALRHYQEALATDPDYDDARVNLGWYYLEKGMMAEAEEEYRRALATNADNAVAHYNLAVLSYYKKEYGRAIDQYRQALRLGYAGNPTFWRALQAFVK